jgi:hypothetical protein
VSATVISLPFVNVLQYLLSDVRHCFVCGTITLDFVTFVKTAASTAFVNVHLCRDVNVQEGS